MPNQATAFPTVLAHAALDDGMAALVLTINGHCLKHHALMCVAAAVFLLYVEQFLLLQEDDGFTRENSLFIFPTTVSQHVSILRL